MAITAKVRVDSAIRQGDQLLVSFSADYADDRNHEWAKYTPALSMSMHVKPELADRFPPGAAFTLTFTREPDVDESMPAGGEAFEVDLNQESTG